MAQVGLVDVPGGQNVFSPFLTLFARPLEEVLDLDIGLDGFPLSAGLLGSPGEQYEHFPDKKAE